MYINRFDNVFFISIIFLENILSTFFNQSPYNLAMKRNKTKGRQKIPMKNIYNKDALRVTFSKCREDFYKKASELVTKCDVDIGIMMISPTGKSHSFFHPLVDVIVSCFQNTDMKPS